MLTKAVRVTLENSGETSIPSQGSGNASRCTNRDEHRRWALHWLEILRMNGKALVSQFSCCNSIVRRQWFLLRDRSLFTGRRATKVLKKAANSFRPSPKLDPKKSWTSPYRSQKNCDPPPPSLEWTQNNDRWVLLGVEKTTAFSSLHFLLLVFWYFVCFQSLCYWWKKHPSSQLEIGFKSELWNLAKPCAL